MPVQTVELNQSWDPASQVNASSGTAALCWKGITRESNPMHECWAVLNRRHLWLFLFSEDKVALLIMKKPAPYLYIQSLMRNKGGRWEIIPLFRIQLATAEEYLKKTIFPQGLNVHDVDSISGISNDSIFGKVYFDLIGSVEIQHIILVNSTVPKQ